MGNEKKTGDADDVSDVEIEVVEIDNPNPVPDSSNSSNSSDSPQPVLPEESAPHDDGEARKGKRKKKEKLGGTRTPMAGALRLIALSLPLFMVIGLSYWMLSGLSSNLLGMAERASTREGTGTPAPAQPNATPANAVLPQMRMANIPFPEGFSAIDATRFAQEFPLAAHAAREDGSRITRAAVPVDREMAGSFLYAAMGGSLDLHSLGVNSFNELKQKIITQRELSGDSSPDDRLISPFNDTGDSVFFGRIVNRDGKTLIVLNCLMQYRDAAIIIAAGHIHGLDEAVNIPERERKCEETLLSWRDMLWNE